VLPGIIVPVNVTVPATGASFTAVILIWRETATLVSAPSLTVNETVLERMEGFSLLFKYLTFLSASW